ncbi:MAG: magnesium transporter CorA family protein [Chloroflexi bacterium]|nr:magnesium transporter CorA family protein [Chloroflexota bacterium]
MSESVPYAAKVEGVSTRISDWPDGFLIFDDLASFSRAVAAETGRVFDFASVVQLATDLVQSSDKYLLLNIKEADGENDLLFLSEEKAYIFSSKSPLLESVKTFSDVLPKPFGRSTILTFVILDKALDSYKQQLEIFIERSRKLEGDFDYVEYRNLALALEHFNDGLEGLHDVLLRLQGSKYKQVESRYIAFDYDILIAESMGLQSRARRRLAVLIGIRQDHDTRATEELNQKIVNLNDVVKKLTAITVILMIPTLIASHFGMNFAFMPELKIWWAYPTVVIAQFMFMGAGIVLFRRIGWL